MKFKIAAHPYQVKILELADGKTLDDLSLREIGKAIGVGASPQKVKHHLTQLVRYGYLDIVGGKYRVGKALIPVE